MEINIRSFEDLALTELYHVLQLRAQVFVVEQDCVYQDLDGKDQKAMHVLGKNNGKVVAYTRIFAPGNYFEQAAIGRVVVAKDQREHGYGKVIMNASIAYISTHFPTSSIKLSAQCHLSKFYNELGFKETGKTYLEDGIPHIAMVRQPQKP